MVFASMEIRLEATTANLWLEEIINGNKSRTEKDVFTHLDRAKWYANAMLEGAKGTHFELQPTGNQQIRENIEDLLQKIELQRKLAKRRLEIRKKGAASLTGIDLTYHSYYDTFIIQTANIENHIRELMLRDYHYVYFSLVGIVIICFFLLLFIGLGIHHFERIRKSNFLELYKTKNHLEDEIKKRKLMERRLIQSEKMMALGRMISGIAHEVNNPNNFISFNLPILREYLQELTPIVDDYARKHPDFELFYMPYTEFRKDLFRLLENIEHGSSRINRMVSELKDFSSKKDEIKLGWIKIKPVIEKAMIICRSKINRIVDSFEINVPDHLPQVCIDPEIVELILVNFLINAAQAANKEKSWIKLNVALEIKKKNSLVIEVCDNGCGIQKDNLSNIFDPFYSTKPSKEGIGLGLYICRTFAEQMGAQIEVESEPGKGSTFRLIHFVNDNKNR